MSGRWGGKTSPHAGVRDTANDALPEGPYKSPFVSKPVYLVQTGKGWVTVLEGEQPTSGTLHGSRQDALAWLRDNGFRR